MREVDSQLSCFPEGCGYERFQNTETGDGEICFFPPRANSSTVPEYRASLNQLRRFYPVLSFLLLENASSPFVKYSSGFSALLLHHRKRDRFQRWCEPVVK